MTNPYLTLYSMEKNEDVFPKIRNKTRMLTLTAPIQYNTGSPS